MYLGMYSFRQDEISKKQMNLNDQWFSKFFQIVWKKK